MKRQFTSVLALGFNDKLAKGKQKGAGVVFGEKIFREMRRGNRRCCCLR